MNLPKYLKNYSKSKNMKGMWSHEFIYDIPEDISLYANSPMGYKSYKEKIEHSIKSRIKKGSKEFKNIHFFYEFVRTA